MGETLTYRNVLNQAIGKSLDLKISKMDIDISKAELKAAKADLYPMLNLQVNTEHNNDLAHSNSFAYAGNTVITPYTFYRNMAYATVSYNLFDFGAVGKKVFIAKKTLEQKEVSHELQLKSLKLKVLDLYTRSLLANEEIKTKTEMLKVYEEIFNAKERLFKAGTTDKISIMDEAINIARTQDDIENSRLELKVNLEDLSTYTMNKYNPNYLEEVNVQQNIIPVSNITPLEAKISSDSDNFSFDIEKSPEARYYNFELEKKKAELAMYKRQRLPVFKMYASYALYGQDLDRYISSIQDVSQRSVTVGISGTFAVFDGFKNKANQEKAIAELKKIELQKDKKLVELMSDFEKTQAAYESYTKELAVKKLLLNKVHEKLESIERMCQNGLIDRNYMLKSKADLLSQEYDLEKNIIDISAKIKEIQILTGRDT